MNNFFDKSFFQNLIVACVSGIVVLIFGLFVSLYIGSQLEEIRRISESVNGSLESLIVLIETGSEGIDEVSTAISENSALVGESVGDGGAAVVNRVGDEIRRFRASE